MIRKQIQSSNGHKNILKDEYDSLIPAYERTRNAVLESISSSEKGRTSGEIYESLPNIDPRRVREALQSLKGLKIIKVEHCRCGSTPIYYVI